MAEIIIKFSCPFSAEDLHNKVKERGIDLVTVYRSLSAFTDLKILNTVDFQDGTLRYEYLHSEEDDHHHHVICTNCRKIEPLRFCAMTRQEKIVEKMGYKDITHKLEFFGLCKKCAH
jgi:Fur family ferric uptake transcriptional regulator